MKNKTIPAALYCNNVFDGTHDTPKPVKMGFPLVTSKNITGGRLNLEDTYNISEEDYKNIQKRSAVSKWDILFSMIGSVGEVYLEANSHIPYAIKNVGVFSCSDEYKAKWLFYYLRSPVAQKFISNYLNGAVQKFLPLGTLRDFPVQEFDSKKISLIDFLYSIDSKIENNNRINIELQKMGNTIYDYWFFQFDFPNEDGKPYKSSGGEMVWNKQLSREIPDGWTVEKIENCCKIVDCLHSKKPELCYEDENSYLLQLENIREDGLLDLINKYYVRNKDYDEWTSRVKVVENDLIITNAGRVAATAQIPHGIETGIGRNITAIRPLNIRPTFLFHAFRSIDMTRQIKMNTDSGAFFSSLNVRGIKELNVIRPLNKIENKFEEISYPIRRKREILNFENQYLTSLRSWLLPLLINGQANIL